VNAVAAKQRRVDTLSEDAVGKLNNFPISLQIQAETGLFGHFLVFPTLRKSVMFPYGRLETAGKGRCFHSYEFATPKFGRNRLERSRLPRPGAWRAPARRSAVATCRAAWSFFRIDPAAAAVSFGACLLQSVLSAFRDHVAIEFCEDGEDAKEQLAHRCGEVEVVFYADEFDLRVQQFAYCAVQMLHRPAKAIQAHGNEGADVAQSLGRVRHQSVEAWPRCCRARDAADPRYHVHGTHEVVAGLE
jgi:hypothetical protein